MSIVGLTPRRSAAMESWGRTLAEEDFVVLPGRELGGWFPGEGLARFAACWERLRRDELVTGGVHRYRQYGRLMAAGDRTGEWGLTPLPHAAFQQSAEHVPLYGGKARMFGPIPPETLADPVLAGLVATDLAIVAAARPGASRFEVGLHMVRVVSAPEVPGHPTPEGRHRDGHDFIGMHLLGRSNCLGGESVVYRPDRPPARMMLAEPLDSLLVSDTRVTHEVTPTIAAGGPGLRDMLLVDINAC